MNLHPHFHPFVAAADHDLIVVFAFVIAIVAIRTFGRAQRQRYWYDVTRVALDKGQPPPAPPPWRDRSWRYGRGYAWQQGLVWIAAGVAFYLIPEHNLRDWAPLPICIGVALVIIGIIASFTSRDPDDRPPAS